MMKAVKAVDLFCGTKTEQVKQIGNSVPASTAKQLWRAALVKGGN